MGNIRIRYLKRFVEGKPKEHSQVRGFLRDKPIFPLETSRPKEIQPRAERTMLQIFRGTTRKLCVLYQAGKEESSMLDEFVDVH